jgi:hypothetical protein
MSIIFFCNTLVLLVDDQYELDYALPSKVHALKMDSEESVYQDLIA